MVEKRRSQRFELKLPVLTVRVGTKPVCNIGQTLNIGSGGVLMVMRAPMAVGEYIEFVVMLSAPAEGRQALRLSCRGTVLRADSFIYAASIDRYEFLRDNGPPTGG